MTEWNLITARRAEVPPRVPESIENRAQLADVISSCQRPSVLMSEREMSVLRRGLTKHGWKRSLYLQPASGYRGIYAAAGMLSRANRGLEQSVEIPECGGCAEDFHCECGAPLRIPDDLSIALDYECSMCSRRSSGEVLDRAIRFFQHQDIVGTALALALVYAIERDKAYADKAAEILLGYADAYSSRQAKPDKGRIVARPADEAACIIALAQAYDLIYYYRKTSSEHRTRIEDGLLRKAAEGFVGLGANGPCGSWHLAAAGVVGFAIREPDLVEHALDATRKQLVEQIGKDGLRPGPLAGTHFRSLAALVHFAEACSRAGIDLYNWEPAPGKSLREMFAAPLQCAYPSLRLPAIDDDPYDSFLPLDLYEIACRRWDDVGFAWVLKKGYKFGELQNCEDHRGHTGDFRRGLFYAFLFGRDLPGRVGLPNIRGRVFPGIGLCTLRAGDGSMATLRCGRCSDTGDNDPLSFTFYSNDALLAPDYGRPAGGRAISEWSACAAAHNTVFVDGGRGDNPPDVALVSAEQGSYLRWARASARGIYPGVDHVRSIVLLDGLCVLVDSLTGQSDHDYDWTIRFDGEARVAGDQAQARMEWNGDPLVQIDQVYDLENGRRVDWAGGNGQVALAIWPRTEQALLAVGSCPADVASRRASIIVCRQRGSDAEFVAALAPSMSGEVELAKEGRVVTASRADRTDHVYVRCGEDETPDQRLFTDAEIAAVRIRDGRVQSVAIMGGSMVRWDGEVLLDCPARVECAEVCFGDRAPMITYLGGTAGVVRIRTTARAMRVNGHRTAASSSDGQALLQVSHQMLTARAPEIIS